MILIKLNLRFLYQDTGTSLWTITSWKKKRQGK